jgi:hypothetical protein
MIANYAGDSDSGRAAFGGAIAVTVDAAEGATSTQRIFPSANVSLERSSSQACRRLGRAAGSWSARGVATRRTSGCAASRSGLFSIIALSELIDTAGRGGKPSLGEGESPSAPLPRITSQRKTYRGADSVRE